MLDAPNRSENAHDQAGVRAAANADPLSDTSALPRDQPGITGLAELSPMVAPAGRGSANAVAEGRVEKRKPTSRLSTRLVSPAVKKPPARSLGSTLPTNRSRRS